MINFLLVERLCADGDLAAGVTAQHRRRLKYGGVEVVDTEGHLR
jgi:hypothetical protein